MLYLRQQTRILFYLIDYTTNVLYICFQRYIGRSGLLGTWGNLAQRYFLIYHPDVMTADGVKQFLFTPLVQTIQGNQSGVFKVWLCASKFSKRLSVSGQKMLVRHIVHFRKLSMLSSVCSVVNYIHRLTALSDLTAFSPPGLVVAGSHIFDGTSWHIYFQQTNIS